MKKIIIALAFGSAMTFNALAMDTGLKELAERREQEKAARRTAKSEADTMQGMAVAGARNQAHQLLQGQGDPQLVAHARDLAQQVREILQRIAQNLGNLREQREAFDRLDSFTRTPNRVDEVIGRSTIAQFFNAGTPRFGQQLVQRVTATLAMPYTEAQAEELFSLRNLIVLGKSVAFDENITLQDDQALSNARDAILDAEMAHEQ